MGKYDSIPPEFRARVRRNSIIAHAVVWAFLVLVCGAIVFITAGAVFEFCGDEEWPTAVFLSLLALYSFSVYWRYINQREEFTQNDYLFRVEHKP